MARSIDPLENREVVRALAFSRARERFPGVPHETLRAWCEAAWSAAVSDETSRREVVERFHDAVTLIARAHGWGRGSIVRSPKLDLIPGLALEPFRETAKGAEAVRPKAATRPTRDWQPRLPIPRVPGLTPVHVGAALAAGMVGLATLQGTGAVSIGPLAPSKGEVSQKHRDAGDGHASYSPTSGIGAALGQLPTRAYGGAGEKLAVSSALAASRALETARGEVGAGPKAGDDKASGSAARRKDTRHAATEAAPLPAAEPEAAPAAQPASLPVVARHPEVALRSPVVPTPPVREPAVAPSEIQLQPPQDEHGGPPAEHGKPALKAPAHEATQALKPDTQPSKDQADDSSRQADAGETTRVKALATPSQDAKAGEPGPPASDRAPASSQQSPVAQPPPTLPEQQSAPATQPNAGPPATATPQPAPAQVPVPAAPQPAGAPAPAPQPAPQPGAGTPAPAPQPAPAPNPPAGPGQAGGQQPAGP